MAGVGVEKCSERALRCTVHGAIITARTPRPRAARTPTSPAPPSHALRTISTHMHSHQPPVAHLKTTKCRMQGSRLRRRTTMQLRSALPRTLPPPRHPLVLPPRFVPLCLCSSECPPVPWQGQFRVNSCRLEFSISEHTHSPRSQRPPGPSVGLCESCS